MKKNKKIDTKNNNLLIDKLKRNKQLVFNLNHESTLENLALYFAKSGGKSIDRKKVGAKIFNCHLNIKDLHRKLMKEFAKETANIQSIGLFLDSVQMNLKEIRLSETPARRNPKFIQFFIDVWKDRVLKGFLHLCTAIVNNPKHKR